MITSLGVSALTVFGFMILMYLLALKLRDNSIVDVCWGLGFLLVAVVSRLQGPAPGRLQYLVTGVVMVWAARLALHILVRNHGKPEDRRYAEMRQRWAAEGHEHLYSLLYVFMLQSLLILVISLPVIRTNSRPAVGLNPLSVAGCVLWVAGFLFETIGDLQLARFKKANPAKGAIMNRGLWRYTRHPNYFGEALMWWAVMAMAVHHPGDLWMAISPALLTFLLLRVSGVPMAEEKRRTDPQFADYVRRTNAFFPGPPRE